MGENAIPPRLHVLQAQGSDRALIIARVRSKVYAFQLWNQSTNQRSKTLWYHGRVYEWRCDLSHDGRFLSFFATVPRPSDTSYGMTGVCRAPWGSPLFRWIQGHSDCGGGIFIDPRTLHLNVIDEPKKLKATPPTDVVRAIKTLPFNVLTEPWDVGEDDPTRQMRLKRDGWWCIEEGGPWKVDPETGVWPEVEPVYRWSPQMGNWHVDYIEEGVTFEQRPGGGHLRRYVMSSGVNVAEAMKIERLDHLAVDRMGRLLVAGDGYLKAVPVSAEGELGEPDAVLNFNRLNPEDAKRKVDPRSRSSLRRAGRAVQGESSRPVSSSRMAARRFRRGKR
ncbi:MAG: hypothetical protein ACF8NJ_04160 [Phycisphaerales bacterium JB038]